MTRLDISIDLETWGTTPGSDIRSIGACVFTPDGRHGPLVHDGSLGTIHPFYMATQGGEAHGLTRDPRTVPWWADQSPEAQGAFADPVDLAQALKRFAEWLWTVGGCLNLASEPVPADLRIWSHGAAFDPPILAAAYAACGLPVPWHYRAPRDTRTAWDMAQVGDHSAWLAAHASGTAHNALDDAVSQARAICAAYARLRLPHDVTTHRTAWRDAIENWSDHTRDDNGSGYYTHELQAFDNTFDALAAYPWNDGK